MNFLKRSSLSLLLFFSLFHALADSTGKGTSVADTNGLMAGFDASFEKGLFKSALDISKHHLTGFIFLKKTPENSYRILFSNQIGIKFFDLEISESNFIVHYCFPSMDRKQFLKVLKNDFRTLLFPFSGIKKIDIIAVERNTTEFKVKSASGGWVYRILNESGRITQMRSRWKLFDKTILEINYTGSSPSRMTIRNPIIRFNLLMELMP